MIALDLRPARKQEMAWIYALFRTSMKQFIEQTWGWDEVLQQHSFDENLPATSWTIAEHAGDPVAACCVSKSDKELYLSMLLVVLQYQRLGIGRQLMQILQQQAHQQQRIMRLSVLRCNPASEFYRRLGFTEESADQYRFRFRWP